MVTSLIDMKIGEIGVVKELRGGENFIQKVQPMGVRIDKKVKKISAHFFRGPLTLEIDNVRFAIGYGMASKIFVEVGI